MPSARPFGAYRLTTRTPPHVAAIARARPDVLLLQETKSADSAAPHVYFRAHGYELAHHGEGRWNGVALASRWVRP